jgi:hypothetical protein
VRARAIEGIKQGLLTPSELLLLHAEEFVGAPGVRDPEDLPVLLPHSEEPVSGRDLCRLLIASAVLANEEILAVRLQTRETIAGGRALAGARGTGLFLRPGNIMPDWPERSLEDSVDFLVGWAARNGHNAVCDLLYHLVEQDGPRPERSIWRLVEDGLGNRGLLQRCGDEECRSSPRRWVLRGRMARFVARESVEPLRRVLERTRRERPEIWALLMGHIDLAIERRLVEARF